MLIGLSASLTFGLWTGKSFGQLSGKVTLAQINQIWHQEKGWQRDITLEYNLGDFALCVGFEQVNLQNTLEDKIDLGLRSLTYLHPYAKVGAGTSLLNGYQRQRNGFYYQVTGYLEKAVVNQRGYFFFQGDKLSEEITELKIFTRTRPQYSLFYWEKISSEGLALEREKNLYFGVKFFSFLPGLTIGIQIAEDHILERRNDGRLKNLKDDNYLAPYLEVRLDRDRLLIKARVKWVGEFDTLAGKLRPLGWTGEQEIGFRF